MNETIYEVLLQLLVFVLFIAIYGSIATVMVLVLLK